MRIIVAILLGILALTGCSNKEPESVTSTVGTYTDEEGTARVVVNKATIQVFIVGDDVDYLYWAGTWTSGKTVISKADTDQNEQSMLGSEDSTTTFHVDGDEIKFTASLGGMTRDVTVIK